jgi:hypothetical protein
MNTTKTFGRWLSLPLVCGTSFLVAAEGEIQQVCNCNRGGGGAVFSAAPIPDYMPPAMPMLAAEPMLMAPPMEGPMMSGSVAPPPGTLGRTYSLKTRILPAEKHPRVGMLEIRTNAEDIVISDTNEFREEDDVKGFRSEQDSSLWVFETKPLLPGVPHVYKIEIINGGVTTNVQYVRLVRGRILELSI